MINRLFELSKKKKLGHLISTLTTLPILELIYNNKKEDDYVILSNGHAGLALYVVLENKFGHDAEKLYDDLGIHPHRDINRNIDVSTGSLGCGILIAVGLAIGNKNKHVHCVISDGECCEGSVWEALSFIFLNNIQNITIYVNMNGFGAYHEIDVSYLQKKLVSFLPSVQIFKTAIPEIGNFKGISAHYYNVDSNDEKEFIINEINNGFDLCVKIDNILDA